MRNFRLTIAYILACVIIIQSSSINVFSESNNSSDLDFKTLKKIAEEEDKLINLEKYEEEMNNASTIEEQFEIDKKYSQYSLVNEKTTYQRNNLEKSLSNMDNFTYEPVSYQPFDVRVTNYNYLAASTTYDEVKGSTLANILTSSINIGMCFVKPIQSVAYTVYTTLFGYMPKEDDYTTLTDVIIRTLHDSRIEKKYIEVYRPDPYGNFVWQVMGVTSKNTQYAQINTVAYKDGKRLDPVNIDEGLIRIDTGKYFNNVSELMKLVKYSSYPLTYNYSEYGSVTQHYKKGVLVKTKTR